MCSVADFQSPFNRDSSCNLLTCINEVYSASFSPLLIGIAVVTVEVFMQLRFQEPFSPLLIVRYHPLSR